MCFIACGLFLGSFLCCCLFAGNPFRLDAGEFFLLLFLAEGLLFCEAFTLFFGFFLEGKCFFVVLHNQVVVGRGHLWNGSRCDYLGHSLRGNVLLRSTFLIVTKSNLYSLFLGHKRCVEVVEPEEQKQQQHRKDGCHNSPYFAFVLHALFFSSDYQFHVVLVGNVKHAYHLFVSNVLIGMQGDVHRGILRLNLT